jgi:hypothetical protein
MTDKVRDNCLCYALRFWNNNPEYRLYYDSNHVINSDCPPIKLLSSGIDFAPIEEYGHGYFSSAFAEYLDEYHKVLLDKYFNLNG